MAEDFERLMNEKMEGASLQEVMPGFDREAVWNELDNRLPQQPKKKVLPLWWTHTAAVAAGVLLGVVLLHSWPGSETGTGERTITTTEKRPASPAVIVKRDTVFVPAAPAAPPGAIAVQTENAIPHQQPRPEPATITAESLHLEPQQPVTEKAAGLQTIVQAPPKKVKAVHLLDIDNENRQTALYHNDPATHYRTGFALQISAQRLPDNNPQQQPGILIKELLK